MSSMPLRCLQLTKFYPPVAGGIETTVRDIATGLSRRHWQVEILCSHTAKETVHETGAIPVTRVASWAQIASTSMSPALIPWLRKRQAAHEVIHVHLPNPMANLALWITRPKAKVVVHWHSDIVKQQRLLKLYKPLQSWLLRRADAVFVTSMLYAQSSAPLQPYMNKVHFAPSCIEDPQALSAPAERVAGAARIRAAWPGKKIVFALGRMTYYKGFDVLIEAAKTLGEDVVVLIGGGGELLDSLREQVRRAGLEERVRLLGRVDDAELPYYFEAADLFCLPSIARSEAFGLVMVEAMAYCRPVVATNISGSGVPWVNLDGETGLNAEPGDPTSLSRCIRRVLDNPELAGRLAQGGRRRFEEHFTLDKMIDAVENVYLNIGARISPRV